MNVDIQGIGMTSKRTRERLLHRLQEKGIKNTAVLNAMLTIPRHMFLDEALAHRAYEDSALPIGFNQTISQPYTVAKMTEVLLAGGPLKNVLEIGTGSGYQTAVLAHLVEQVYSVERIKPLQEKARQRLSALKLYNFMLKHSDGEMGWLEKAPFDGIIVTAAPLAVPQELLQQLMPGGRLVVPVGGEKQELQLITQAELGVFNIEVIESAKFVPLVSGIVR